MTTQSAKETQQRIDEKLGLNAKVLARTIFHGQHSLNGLLESTDTSLKDELSLVVPTTIWQSAVSLARKRGREATKSSDEVKGMISLRTSDITKLVERLEDATAVLARKENEFFTKESALLAELDALELSEGGVEGHDLSALEKCMEESAKSVAELETTLVQKQNDWAERITGLEGRLKERRENFSLISNKAMELSLQKESLSVTVASAQERVQSLETTWGLDLSSGAPIDFSLPSKCPTCRQPIQDGRLHDHDHDHDHSLMTTVVADSENAIRRLKEASGQLHQVENDLGALSAKRKSAEEDINRLQAELDAAKKDCATELKQIDESLASTRKESEQASLNLASLVKYEQRSAKGEQLRALLEREREALRPLQGTIEGLRNDIAEYEAVVEQLQQEQEEYAQRAKLLATLSDHFGQRGIQTFVLQSSVDALQVATQLYLDDLSDGAQRLLLALDTGDRISRRALVRQPNGEFSERPLASLSGGQWRRCALALNLGFADLVARKGRLRPSICVMDEPLTHLDRTGKFSPPSDCF